MNLVLETFADLKKINDKAELKHSVNLIFKDNNLSISQILDRRTKQLIDLYKARELKKVYSLDYYIFYEALNILTDTEPRMF